MNDPIEFREQIKQLLDQLAKNPANLLLHQRLRQAALQHKAAGGPDLGILAKLKCPRDPLQRLLHAQRLWCFDPGNVDRVLQLVRALESYSNSFPDANIEPIRLWLTELLMRMAS